MQRQKILKLDLSCFPEDERAAQIPGKLFLIDNLNDPITVKDQIDMQDIAQVAMVVIFICKNGRVDVQIDRKDYTMRGGDVMSLLPGTVFQFVNTCESTECAVIALHPDFINYTSDVKLGIEFARMLHDNPIQKLDYPMMEEAIGIYKAIKNKLYRSGYRYKEEVAKNYLNIMKCNVFDELMKNDSELKEERPSSRKEELFNMFLKKLKTHYKTERNVTFYADKLCVTPKYLSAVIHDVSGKYATEWIVTYVIMDAKNMLKNENRSVKDVCHALNFANQSFFAKYFKQHTGFTPKEYKNL